MFAIGAMDADPVCETKTMFFEMPKYTVMQRAAYGWITLANS